MTTTTTKIDIAIELGKAMTELRNKLRQNMQVKIKEHKLNLTFEMLEVLACLWKKNGMNQQEVADMTMKDKSSITYLIDNLAKRSLVKRVEDGNDRRNKLIYLTDEAEQLRERLYPWVNEMYTLATENVQADELLGSIQVMNKMIQNLT